MNQVAQESYVVPVTTKVTPTEKNLLDLAARRIGRPLSDLVRERLADLIEIGTRLDAALDEVEIGDAA
jgi:hypothetical protein